MPVLLEAPLAQALHPVPGIEIGVVQAGIRKANRYDLSVFKLAPGTTVAGVFTRNRFCAAPVQVCQAHLASGAGIRALLINTGNANAGTGATGLVNARATATALAQALQLKPEQVLPFSTGVILEPLPVDRVVAGLPAAIAAAKEDNWLLAAQGIMTTDTIPKAASRQVLLGGRKIHVTGIAKGAGMIRPNMATMLSFIGTDAAVPQSLLNAWLSEIVNQSFNRITVDGDTSTNDSLVLMASGASGFNVEGAAAADADALKQAIREVAQQLAQAIVRDGEGATKFITVTVEQAKTEAEAAQVAYAIAHSPLVKTAFFASDPNLGRILAAVGYAGVDDLDQARIELYLDEVHVATSGGRHPDYREAQGQAVMKKPEILVRVLLGRGRAATTVWTCDFSHEYVSINADYRS